VTPGHHTVDDVAVVLSDGVAVVEMQRPPNNYFDLALIRELADVYEEAGRSADVRAIVLCSSGKHFCAGADFSSDPDERTFGDLYTEAHRLFAAPLPVVAAVQGAAVGGGLGLACSADFRVVSADSRLAANFARLGLHHGFALSVTLPSIVGRQIASELLLTGRRITGEEASRCGLADRLAPVDQVRSAAVELAQEIAGSAPLAVRSIRQTLRHELLSRVREATDHEAIEQQRLAKTTDFAEGVNAMAERRPPRFTGS
jgi:2-(1,2-epoxy-1,2-dihydrophenyl)acetyl-CoA isomerase